MDADIRSQEIFNWQNNKAIMVNQMNLESGVLDEISLRRIAGILMMQVIVTVQIGEALGNNTVDVGIGNPRPWSEPGYL